MGWSVLYVHKGLGFWRRGRQPIQGPPAVGDAALQPPLVGTHQFVDLLLVEVLPRLDHELFEFIFVGRSGLRGGQLGRTLMR